MLGLDQTATVFGPDPTTGAYTLVERDGLRCRLALVNVGAEPGEERPMVDATRRLLWAADFAMPETAQVEIDGERWNARPGTFAAVRGPAGTVLYRRAEMVRAT